MTPLQSEPQDKHKFSEQAVACLRSMGDYVFHNPLHTVPWGGRPHVLGRRYILQKYLTNEDILQAHWVQEKAMRTDPRWRDKEPGLSHLAMLMRERSAGRWQDEQHEFQQKTPSLLDYMDEEWGAETRQALALHRQTEASQRRASFHLVPST